MWLSTNEYGNYKRVRYISGVYLLNNEPLSMFRQPRKLICRNEIMPLKFDIEIESGLFLRAN